MASNIDETQPPAGAATTAAMRANMAAAKAEIEALQQWFETSTQSDIPGYKNYSPGYWRASPIEAILLPAATPADNQWKSLEIANTMKFNGQYPPADAKILLLNLDIAIKARGTAGFHEVNMYINSEDVDTESGYNIAIAAWEPAGLAAGTWFAGDQRVAEFPVVGPNLKIKFKLLDLPTNTSDSNIQGWRITGFRR